MLKFNQNPSNQRNTMNPNPDDLNVNNPVTPANPPSHAEPPQSNPPVTYSDSQSLVEDQSYERLFGHKAPVAADTLHKTQISSVVTEVKDSPSFNDLRLPPSNEVLATATGAPDQPVVKPPVVTQPAFGSSDSNLPVSQPTVPSAIEQNPPAQQLAAQPTFEAQQTSPVAVPPVVNPDTSASFNTYAPQPLPVVSPPRPPRNSPAKIIIIIVGAIVLLGLACLAVYLVYSNMTKSSNVISVTVGGNSDIIDRTDGKLSLTTLIDKQQTIKSQNLKAKINQQVNLSDGISIMVTNVQRNWVSADKYLVAGTGKELMKVKIAVGNRDKQSTLYIGSSDFKVINSAGGLQSPRFVSEGSVPTVFASQDIAPGKQASGELIYEVDKGENISALVMENQYKDYTSDQQVNVKAEIALK
jgi:hypothetical protein